MDSLNSPTDREYMEELCLDNSLQGMNPAHYFPKVIQSANLLQHECSNTTPQKLHHSSLVSGQLAPRFVGGSKNYVLDMTKQHNPSDHSIMGKLHTKKAEMRSIEMSAECMDQMAAGIDTTGDGL